MESHDYVSSMRAVDSISETVGRTDAINNGTTSDRRYSRIQALFEERIQLKNAADRIEPSKLLHLNAAITNTLRAQSILRELLREEATVTAFEQCCNAFEMQHLRLHERVFEQGDPSDNFFVVLRGRVGLFTKTQLFNGQDRYLLVPITPPVLQKMTVYRRSDSNNPSEDKKSISLCVRQLLHAKKIDAMNAAAITAKTIAYFLVEQMREGDSIGGFQVLWRTSRSTSCFSLDANTVLLSLGKYDFLRILRQTEESKLLMNVMPLMDSPAISFLSTNAIKDVFVKAFRVRFGKDCVICTAGSVPSAVFIVLSGEFSLWTHATLNANKQPPQEGPYQVTLQKYSNSTPVKMSIIGVGEIFGDTSVLLNERYSHTLISDSAAGEVLVIPSNVFEQKVCANQDFADIILNRSGYSQTQRQELFSRLVNSLQVFRHFRYDAEDTDPEDSGRIELNNRMYDKYLKEVKRNKCKTQRKTFNASKTITKMNNSESSLLQPSSVDSSAILKNTIDDQLFGFKGQLAAVQDATFEKNHAEQVQQQLKDPQDVNRIPYMLTISSSTSQMKQKLNDQFCSSFYLMKDKQESLEGSNAYYHHTSTELNRGKHKQPQRFVRYSRAYSCTDRSSLSTSSSNQLSSITAKKQKVDLEINPVAQNQKTELLRSGGSSADVAALRLIDLLYGNASEESIAVATANSQPRILADKSSSLHQLDYQKTQIYEQDLLTSDDTTMAFNFVMTSQQQQEDLFNNLNLRIGSNDEYVKKQQHNQDKKTRVDQVEESRNKRISRKHQKEIIQWLKNQGSTGSFQLTVDEKTRKKMLGFDKKTNYIQSWNTEESKRVVRSDKGDKQTGKQKMGNAVNDHPSKEVAALLKTFKYKPNHVEVFNGKLPISKRIELEEEQQKQDDSIKEKKKRIVVLPVSYQATLLPKKCEPLEQQQQKMQLQESSKQKEQYNQQGCVSTKLVLKNRPSTTKAGSTPNNYGIEQDKHTLNMLSRYSIDYSTRLTERRNTSLTRNEKQQQLKAMEQDSVTIGEETTVGARKSSESSPESMYFCRHVVGLGNKKVSGGNTSELDQQKSSNEELSMQQGLLVAGNRRRQRSFLTRKNSLSDGNNSSRTFMVESELEDINIRQKSLTSSLSYEMNEWQEKQQQTVPARLSEGGKSFKANWNYGNEVLSEQEKE